jgi:TonB-dependent starch-binding outer membrane protein SusC
MKFVPIPMKLRRISLLVLFLSLFVQHLHSQTTVEITGVVLDAEFKDPLVFANVVEKGTNTGTVTDSDGRFSLRVRNTNATLVISFMGFKTKEFALNGRTDVAIELDADASVLDDVVVIGYGTVKKSDLTGSVATISGKDIQKVPIANVSEALTGRLAGVQITSSEGSPDSEIRVRVRGGGSLTQDSSPLYIVDGFPVDNINDISPSDIETITVLKDASSTAIYGARGSYGVILITTKSGIDGSKLNIGYNFFGGFGYLPNTIDVLDPADYVKWQYEEALLRNNLTSFTDFFGAWEDRAQYDNVKGTNWQREIYGRTGQVQSHDLSLRGGTEKLRYSFNYAHYDQQAIMIGSSFKRNNISFNLKNKVSNKVDLGFTMRYSETNIRGGGANEQREFSSSDARYRHSVGYAPIPIPGLVTDDTDEAVAGYLVNPFVAVDDNDRLQKRQNINMMGSFSWKAAKNLKFKSDFGVDHFLRRDDRFYGRSTFYVSNVPSSENQGRPALITSDRHDVRFRITNTLDYDFKKYLSDDHSLRFLLGQEYLNFKFKTQESTIHGFPKFFTFNNAINLMGQGDPLSINNFVLPDDRLLSFFGRVNYDYKSKYLFTATLRADGSSKFLGDNRWGYFPSAAVAWKIKEETFLKEVSWLDELKVRFSYGMAGNNNIPTGQQIPVFIPGATTWLNDITNFWAPSNILANPDLRWETMVTQNLGLDYEILKGRISGSLELYKNSTKDLLLNFIVPEDSGYSTQFRNTGENRNSGLEATLNLEALKGKDYGLNIAFNIGMNRNEIISLGTLDEFGIPSRWASTAINDDFLARVGSPVGLMIGYKLEGRYEVSDFSYNNGTYTLLPDVPNSSTVVGNVRPGSMRIKDVNGDGVINQDDITVIGDPNPASTGGLVLNGFWKNFDITAAFNWSFGNDVYNASKIEHTSSTFSAPNGQYRNLTTVMSDGNRWTNLDPVSGQLVTDPVALSALNANTTMWSPYMARFVLTDWAIEDGSFLRLNTLSLGYTFPEGITEKIGASRFRVYATANNVFILTKYSGLDPEVNTRRQTPLTPGVDYSPFPRSRQFVFGVNLSF